MWVNGKMNGFGELSLGERKKISELEQGYEGQWVDDERDGLGREVSEEENGIRLEYFGEFSKDEKHGFGMLKINDQTMIGNFIHDVFQSDSETEKGLCEATNVDYLGGWQDFKKEGHGVLLKKDGFKFVGSFLSDKNKPNL